MPDFDPPADFGSAALDIATIGVGQRYGRIYRASFPDPLGFGKTPSRFSDSRKRIASNRFGVVYLGSTFTVCFVEAVLRDQRNGVGGSLLMDEAELHELLYAEIDVIAPLSLVDLRKNARLRMGIPSDVAGGAKQTLARKWSVAINRHSSAPDGIIFPSRLNGETNLAIYDRAVPKLQFANKRKLISVPDLVSVLDVFKIGLCHS
jgi:hypothetical protein